MTMALRRPFPRTLVTNWLGMVESSSRRSSPSRKARPARFSSTMTRKAAMATLQASGLPPYVDPCSPGLIQSMTSSSASTADTCRRQINFIMVPFVRLLQLLQKVERNLRLCSFTNYFIVLNLNRVEACLSHFTNCIRRSFENYPLDRIKGFFLL